MRRDEDRRETARAEDEGEIGKTRPGGPTPYEESGGTGLRPRSEDEVIGGGPSGGDEDPIGEPGIPDEAAAEPTEDAGDRAAADRPHA